MSKTNPTCAEIIRQFLGENGYDGLCSDECGCLLDDLMPCGSGEFITGCVAGYRQKVPPDQVGECDFWVGLEKPREEKSDDDTE